MKPYHCAGGWCARRSRAWRAGALGSLALGTMAIGPHTGLAQDGATSQRTETQQERAVAGGAPEVLTLDQAIDMALRHNRGAQSALLQVQRANAQLQAARALGRPTLSALLLGSHRLHRDDAKIVNEAVGILPPPFLSLLSNQDEKTQGVAGASLMQPLTQLRRIRLGVAARQAGVEVAREEVRGKRQEVTAQVRQTYYALLSAQGSQETSLATEAFYAELERTVTELLAEQAVLRADLLEVQARKARQQGQSATARDGVATLQERLNLLLGRDIATPFETEKSSALGLDAPALPQPTDPSHWEERALTQRPEVRRAALSLHQAELDRRAKQGEAVPDISLGLTYATPLNVDALPTNNLSLGIMVRWDVFDGGRRAGEVKEKSAAVAQAQLALQDARAAVRADVRERARALSTAGQNVRASALARDAALERRRVAQDRFAEKAALLKDVLEAQSRVTDAERQYQDDLLSVANAQSNLTRALGED